MPTHFRRPALAGRKDDVARLQDEDRDPSLSLADPMPSPVTPREVAVASPEATSFASPAPTSFATLAATAAPVVVGTGTALAGSLGAQSWGALGVSAASWTGAAAAVRMGAQGLGVAGGRFADQIDHNPATGQSETLTVHFPGPVDQATLRIARLLPSESGGAEVGAWRAFDAAGALVGQGVLDPRGKAAVATTTYDFVIDLAADFARLVLSARGYNNAGTTGGSDSSDFALARVSYLAAAPAPATPGLVVTQSGGSTAVAEGGATDSVSVALRSAPTANVTVTIAGAADVTLAKAGAAAAASATLTFTPQNWSTAQTVTVAAVDDRIAEGPETATLGLTAASADARYAALAPQSVAVAVADNDTAGLVLVQSGGSTTVAEGGAGDGFTLALASAPTANVTVTIGGSADLLLAKAGGALAGSATLTFTPQNWSTAQTVSVAAVDDRLAEPGETASLTIATQSTDRAYDAVADRLLPVAVQDNDGAGGPPAGAIHVAPGADIQALVNGAATGAVFWIEAGLHRMQSITPKAGQHFIGEEGAVLSGARLLSGWTQGGSTWSVGGQTQQGLRNATGEAEDGFPRGGYPDAVYLDDRPLLHVDSLSQVRPGTYYFDYAADRIHIGDNPAGHRVEAAVSPFAFQGGATGVTVENLVIEKYAAPAQRAAIGGNALPEDWVIRDNEVRLNYGVGISVGSGTEVLGNSVHDNGEMGVGAVGRGILFQGNEIAANGFWSGIDVYWEGGGSKFAETDGLIVRGNFVHHNHGYGLWTDINNIDTLYEGNRVEHNTGSGINHEISYDAVIRNNTLVGNGAGFSVWLWGAGIQVQNSSNVEIYGNFVDMTEGGNGIALIQQERGTGDHGPWVTHGNHVHDNVVVSRTPDHGSIGATADFDEPGLLAGGNLFDHNEYRVTSAADDRFVWGDYYSWAAYRAASGWDAHSTLVLI